MSGLTDADTQSAAANSKSCRTHKNYRDYMTHTTLLQRAPLFVEISLPKRRLFDAAEGKRH